LENPESPLFEALVRGVGGAAVGLGVGVFCLLVGLLGAGVALLAGVHVGMDQIWPAAGVYVLGFAVGGAVMAALWPDEPRPVRQYVAGALGGIVTMSFVAAIAEKPHVTWAPRTTHRWRGAERKFSQVVCS